MPSPKKLRQKNLLVDCAFTVDELAGLGSRLNFISFRGQSLLLY